MKISLSSLEKRFLTHHQAGDDFARFDIQSQSSEVLDPEAKNDNPYDQGYVTNQDGVAADMLTFIRKFYDNFPEKRKADLFLTSESYGGKSHRVISA